MSSDSAACTCGTDPLGNHDPNCPAGRSAATVELRGVRLRDVYRDKDGELWEVVSLCDQPIAGFRRVKDGEQVDHVIGCLNMKMQFPKGGVRV